MKTVTDDRIVFQGDVMFERAADIPKEATLLKEPIVAHSETGHHHVALGAEVFAMPGGMDLYMKSIGKSIDVVHKRPTDTHETLRFLTDEPGTVWHVRRQREYTPQGWRRVED